MGKKTRESVAKSVDIKGRLLIILSLTVTLLLGAFTGIYLPRCARVEAERVLLERDSTSLATRDNGYAVQLLDGVTSTEVESRFEAEDESFKGIISQDAVMWSGIINEDGESLETYTLVNDSRLYVEFITKNDAVEIPNGYYPIYATGYEWENRMGERLTLQLTAESGETYEYRVVIAGSVDPKPLSDILYLQPYDYSYRSLVVIDGINLLELYPNADESLFIYTDINLADVFRASDFGVKGGTSEYFVQRFASQAITQPSDLYKPYYCVVVVALSIIILMLIGGRNRTILLIGYSGVSAVAMLLYFYLSILPNTAIPYVTEKFVLNWFYWLLVFVVFASLAVALIYQTILVLRDRSIEKRQNVGDENIIGDTLGDEPS